MSNLLLSYLNKRMSETEVVSKSTTQVAGPVITISREIGCNGLKLASKIADHLNSKIAGANWKVISKEVFHESAKELKMDPEKLRKTLHQHEKFTFDDILNAFNDKNYKTDLMIVKTMKKIILQIATEGNCIIVGRGGHVIAANIKKALHIRLIAPIEYRINTTMNNNNLNREEAIDFIKQVDKERTAFRKAILKQDPQNEIYDITFNRAAFNEDEIIDLIEQAAAKKNVI